MAAGGQPGCTCAEVHARQQRAGNRCYKVVVQSRRRSGLVVFLLDDCLHVSIPAGGEDDGEADSAEQAARRATRLAQAELKVGGLLALARCWASGGLSLESPGVG